MPYTYMTAKSVVKMAEIRNTIEVKRTMRWLGMAGIGAMIGGGAAFVASILDNVAGFTETSATPEYATTWAMFTIGAILLLIGAVAIHVRYAEEYGRLGAAGAALAGLGFLSMTVGSAWSIMLTGPVGESSAGGLAFFGLLVAALGSFVLALGLRRVDGLTRGVALLLAAPVVFVSTFVVGEALADLVSLDVLWILFLLTFYTGWITLGDTLRRDSGSANLQSESVPSTRG